MFKIPKLFHPPGGEEEKHAYHTLFEKKFTDTLSPFQQYIKTQTTASILLFLCTLVALFWASLPAIANWYSKFINIHIGAYIANLAIKGPLQFWVNDVLLTLFFFFVGLEIKREFLVGGLTDRKRAILVLFAAIGGMLLPTSIYLIFNTNTPTEQGWGIPMATDTAFALGILSCFRKKLSKGVFTFLAALAIIDDIGAITVVAVFYTPHLNIFMLFYAIILAGFLILLNFTGVRKAFLYLIIGFLIWIFIEEAGIHGTIAGIVVAFLIPSRPKKGPIQFLKRTRVLLRYFELRKKKQPLILEDQKQHAVLEEVQEIALQATTPLQRWASKLELPISLIVLPLFALVNAGIPINLYLLNQVLTQRVSLGILLGLIIGKPIGVLLFSRIALWTRLGKLPENTQFTDLLGVALLTGIGFTMSLFISNLSFQIGEEILVISKAAILFGSLFSALLGIIVLLVLKK